jgi:hypothetical protein
MRTVRAFYIKSIRLFFHPGETFENRQLAVSQRHNFAKYTTYYNGDLCLFQSVIRAFDHFLGDF